MLCSHCFSRDFLALGHFTTQNLDLRFEGAPEDVLVERVVVFIVAKTRFVIVLVGVAGEVEQCGDESFLEVGEAEVLGDVGDGVAELAGEVDGFLVLELVSPVRRCKLLATKM